MINNKLMKLKISKKHLLKAALYRRMAMQTGGLDKVKMHLTQQLNSFTVAY